MVKLVPMSPLCAYDVSDGEETCPTPVTFMLWYDLYSEPWSEEWRFRYIRFWTSYRFYILHLFMRNWTRKDGNSVQSCYSWKKKLYLRLCHQHSVFASPWKPSLYASLRCVGTLWALWSFWPYCTIGFLHNWCKFELYDKFLYDWISTPLVINGETWHSWFIEWLSKGSFMILNTNHSHINLHFK